MINITTIPLDRLSLTTRIICQELQRRDWNAWIYREGVGHMRIQRPDGVIIEVFSSTPPTTSYVAGLRADDKHLTHLLLEEAGLPVPHTYFASSPQEALQYAQEMIDAHTTVVVKPLDSAHGNGVTVGITSREAAADAVTVAGAFSQRFIVQEQVSDPIDLRLSCIDYKLSGALVRLPARVEGDGVHTVHQLIELTNASGQRGENYSKPLNVISIESAARYLGTKKMHSVPAKGQWVAVLGTANVGTGGETVDITDDLPQWLTDMAEHAARTSSLPVCGVDFLVQATPTPASTVAELQPIIIELNKAPALFLHEMPTYGQARPVVKEYIDYLARIDIEKI